MRGPTVADPSDVVFPPQRLLGLYAEMNRTLLEPGQGADTVAAVTRLAVAAVPGVEQASISEGRNGRFRTVASTGDLATAADQIQYELRTGPCVDAIVEDAVYCSNDISLDTRWPAFGARAHAETGATSMMSLRLFFEGDDRIAGLNLYSTRADAFDDQAHVIANLVATHSVTALIAASAREKVSNLQRALTSNRRIGMAMGVLMTSHNLTEHDAVTLLRIASQNSNRKLTDIADDVITTGTLELPAPRSATSHRHPKSSRPESPAASWFDSKRQFWPQRPGAAPPSGRQFASG
jgi:ANTAR domain